MHGRTGPNNSAPGGPKVGTAITWNIIWLATAQGTTFITNAILANLLSSNDFGAFGMLQSTVMAILPLAQLSIGTTAGKFVSEYHRTDRLRTGRIIATCLSITAIGGICAAIVLALSARWLAGHLLHNSELAPLLSFISLSLPTSCVNGAMVGIIAGLGEFKGLGIRGILSITIQTLLAYLLAWKFSLWGAGLGLNVNNIAQFVILLGCLRSSMKMQGIELSLRSNSAERQLVLGFAIPATLSGLTAMPALWWVSTLLAAQPAGYMELAMFKVSSTLRGTVMFLPLVIYGVVSSFLNRERGEKRFASYRTLYARNIAWTAASVLLGAIALSLAGPSLLRIFGRTYVQGNAILLVLLLSCIPEAIAIAVSQPLQTHAKMWLSFAFVSLPRDALLIGLATVLVPKWNGLGLAIAYGISWLCILFVISILVFISCDLKEPQEC